MGDPQLADSSVIMINSEHNDPDWSWRPYYMHVDANWQLLVDNIFDLTHVAYIHAKTIGGNPQSHFEAESQVSFENGKVSLLRKMPNSIPLKPMLKPVALKET